MDEVGLPVAQEIAKLPSFDTDGRASTGSPQQTTPNRGAQQNDGKVRQRGASSGDNSILITDFIRTFEYDSAGNQTASQYTALTGKVLRTETDYDDEGRVIATRQLVDGVIQSTGSTTYNDAGQVETSTDAFGNVTTNRYDIRGNLVETRTPAKDENGVTRTMVTRTAYDNNGRAIASLDPFIEGVTSLANLRVTHTIYDDLGRVVETRRLAGVDITITEDSTSYSESVFTTAFNTSYAGSAILSSTQTFYDATGRVSHTLSATGARTDYYYDVAGRQTAVLSPVVDLEDGSQARLLTVYVYDVVGQQTEVASAIAVTDSLANWDSHPTLYDGNGDFLAGIDASAAQTTRFIYDALGRVTRTTQLGDDTTVADDVTTQTIYDALGRRVAEIDPLNRRTDYEYDDAGRLTKVTLPDVPDPANPGQTARPIYEYTYDTFGNQTAITDPNNHVTNFTFDHFGRQVNRVLPLGVETTGDPDDFTEQSIFDDTPIATVQAGSTPEHSFGAGQLAFSVDFEGNVTRYYYDNTALGGGRLVEKVYFDADDITATITATMTVAQMDAALAGVTADRAVTYSYDVFGRTLEVDDDGFAVATSYEYDAEGRTTSITSAQGTIRYEYDALGRLTRTYTGLADDAHSSTSSDGKAVTDTRYTYDSLGRLKTVSLYEREDTPLATPETTTYEYDLVGNLDMQVTQWNDVVADYQYDALNRLEILTHYYDENGNRTFDGIDEERASFVYQYQLDGGRTQVIETDDQGDVTTIDYVYDSLGRLTLETIDSDDDSLDATTTYVYDQASNRINTSIDYIHDGYFDESVAYVYDANDRLLNETVDQSTDAVNPLLDASGNGHNLDSQQTAVFEDGQFDQAMRFDGTSQFVDLEDGSTYTHDAFSNRTVSLQFKADVDTSTGLTQNLFEQGGGTSGIGIRLNNGQLEARVNTGGSPGVTISVAFTDTADWHHVAAVFEGDLQNDTGILRLYLDGQEVASSATTYATIDAHSDDGAIGARNDDDVWGASVTGNYFDGLIDEVRIYSQALVADDIDRLNLNQQPSIAAADVVAHWHFDTEADRYIVYGYDHTTQTSKTTWTDATQTTKVAQATYHYDAMGRMAQVEIDSNGDGNINSTETYTYNQSGIRIAKTVDDGSTQTTTTYHIDPQNHTGYAQTLEEFVDGVLAKTFTLGHDVIAQASAAAAQVLSLLYDGHGSTRAVVDEVGDVIQRYAYDAYGVQLTGTGLTSAANALTTLLYSGEHTNAATGLQYLRARWYNPSNGRFNRLDPFAGNASDPVSLHKYLYAHANPVRFVDPSGLTSLGEISAATFVVAVLLVLSAPNVANAPNNTDPVYSDAGGQLVLDLPITFATLGVGKLVTRFVINPLAGAVSPHVRALLSKLRGGKASPVPDVRTPITDPSRLLPGPGPQITQNQSAGIAFEESVRNSLRTTKGVKVVSPSGVSTIPDLPTGNLYGVTDIKNVISLSQRRQLRAMADVADDMGLPFNLIISPRTEVISRPLQQRITQTGGTIFEFDATVGLFKEVTIIGNQVIR